MKTSASIRLQWTGPRSLPGDLIGAERIPAAAGVYLWTVLREGKDYIHYVGSSYDLRNRHLEHAVWHLGGGYWLPKFGDRGQEGLLEEKHLDMPADAPREVRYEVPYERVAWLGKAPENFKKVRDILREIRIFWATTVTADEARAAEYIIQRKLQVLSVDDDARRFLPKVSLQGSRPPKDRTVRLGHSGEVETIVGLQGLRQLPEVSR